MCSMRQENFYIVILICLFIVAPYNNTQAQSNLKCPPKKSFFKSEKKKGFLSGLFTNDKRPKAKVFYEPEPAVSREPQKAVKSNLYKDDRKESRKNKRIAKRLQRSNNRQVASTGCPRR